MLLYCQGICQPLCALHWFELTCKSMHASTSMLSGVIKDNSSCLKLIPWYAFNAWLYQLCNQLKDCWDKRWTLFACNWQHHPWWFANCVICHAAGVEPVFALLYLYSYPNQPFSCAGWQYFVYVMCNAFLHSRCITC